MNIRLVKIICHLILKSDSQSQKKSSGVNVEEYQDWRGVSNNKQ